MKLIWVKINHDILVGEAERLPADWINLSNPMMLQYINIAQQSKVISNGKQPEVVTGFKFVPLPCSEIRAARVDYAGEINKHDPVFVSYYKVLKAIKKQLEDPLMVAQ